ncbi:uncharacterized protein LOC114936193 [Nylanderia fulva]|uniref:uncharacterized protein LOC114936193 n=1 Tax=Nylanderia fulva TaxID=613905 RepID=UPI0010FBA924|nr:uncharacterized protein LOC114936193 [Nylanderia fulva]
MYLIRSVNANRSGHRVFKEIFIQNATSFEFFTVNDYLSRIQKLSIQKYFNLTEKDVAEFQYNPIRRNKFPIRTFVEFDNVLIKKDIFVSFRWDIDPEIFGDIKLLFKIWFEDQNRIIQLFDKKQMLEYKVYDINLIQLIIST